MRNKIVLVLCYLACILATQPVSAQLSQREKGAAIDSIAAILNAKYVFPEMARRMEDAIRNQFATGKYDSIRTGEQLADVLMRELQAISKDQHLKVNYSPKKLKDTTTRRKQTTNTQQQWLDQLLTENNYGIKQKKILEGNIGYLDLPLFGPLDRCADSLVSAMRWVENTNALIIDLRSCRGSLDENTIPFLCGYFFKNPVQLSDFYLRATDFTQQFWTAAWVPGRKYLNKPVYLLTSGRTFSGGEAIAYDLQQLKRVRIFGETTRGGAHPTEYCDAGNGFSMSVPYARTINPMTQTNWEGIGVQPDSIVPSNLALFNAHTAILQSMLDTSQDQNKRQSISQSLAKVQASKPILQTISFVLEGYEQAKEVSVSGSFNFFSRRGLRMYRNGTKWVAEALVEKGPLTYVFVVDGRMITDPNNPNTVRSNGNNNSVMEVR